MIIVPARANEDWFRNMLIDELHAQNVNVLHIREAQHPGPTDLLIWAGGEIMGWVELKVEDHAVEVSQKEFMRHRDREAGNAYLFRLRRKTGEIQCFYPDEGTPFHVIDDLRRVLWRQFFWTWRRDATRYK